jgi:hypothetical protein
LISKVHLAHPVSHKWHITDKTDKGRRFSVGKTALWKLLILLPYAWVSVQISLFPHYFLKNGIGIVTTVGLLLGYRGKPKLSPAIARMWGKTHTIFYKVM